MINRRTPKSRRATEERRDLDRRIDSRDPSNIAVRFLRSGQSGNTVLTGEILDVSQCGIRLALDDEIENGQKLLIEVRDATDHRMNLTATIVWIDSLDDSRLQVGCELAVELLPNQQDLLMSLAAPADSQPKPGRDMLLPIG
jgi:exoribonuclease II